MKLVSFRVQTYRNFVDSTTVETDEQVTCLVGRPERTEMMATPRGSQQGRDSLTDWD